MKRLLLILYLLTAPAFAGENETDYSKSASGLPLPRFASLRSDEVNMRTGPGTRYPIDWVMKQKGLPVEITAEFEIWRRVREPEGSEGWVHVSAISGKRMAIVTAKAQDLRKNPDDTSPIVARLESGAVGQLVSCSADWCRLKFDSVKGWLRKSDFWGAYKDETFN